MKYMILSDIHGSSFYLEKAIKIFKENNYDQLLLLGDILYHGPRNPLPEQYNCPKVSDILNNIKDKIVCVKGNCDSEVDQMVLEFEIKDSYQFRLGKRMIHLTHGHKYNMEKIPPYMNEYDILFYGHFHIPFIEEKYNMLFCNPGSISLPKLNTPHSYISLTEEKIEILDIDENVILEKNIRM